MANIKVSLFRKFSMIGGEMGEYKIKVRKVRELFDYVLVIRNLPQPRESSCGILRVEQPATMSG